MSRAVVWKKTNERVRFTVQESLALNPYSSTLKTSYIPLYLQTKAATLENQILKTVFKD